MNAIKQAATAVSPLAHTTLRATITDLLCEYELRHIFRNEGGQAIEAVYSFPMPLDAAFIGMDATLAGETLSAQVLPAQQASCDYDHAISEGHSAVLLEQLHLGLLCVNLGNLKPGESGEIVLRFAAALNVADGVARFSLPLVHRPRYGRSRLDDVAQPQNDFWVEHPLDAEIRVRGLLAARPVQCATHGVRFAHDAGELVLHIAHALLDRDLVLNFDLGAESLSQARWIADGDGSLGVVSFTVPQIDSNEAEVCDICLLLDCSGSMQGDAIAQSRAALQVVTDALREQDRIQVIRFGSSTSALFRRPLQATARVKEALRDLKDTVNANLGGTKMDAALQKALAALDGNAPRKVIILVTDGAVNAHEIELARNMAIRKGVRVFVVAVGSSAGVDALTPLVLSTQATLERAVPAEPIDAGVMRQLRRARSQPVNLDIAWTGTPVQRGTSGVVYPGDALTLVARFADQHPITASVRLAETDRKLEFAFDELQSLAAWRAWAGQRLYLHAGDQTSEREALALRYGLITPETQAVLVKQRAEADKIDGLPTVTPVAHMVPAGMVVASPRMAYLTASVDTQVSKDYLDIPMFMRRQTDDDEPVARRSLFKRQPKSPPALKLVVKTALAQALLHLFAHGENDSFTLNDLLARIDSQWHKAVREYGKYHGLERFDRARAAVRLLALLEDGVTIEIDDDEEAQLAIYNTGF